jgi:transcriptional regulator with XRE-family HTH domain
MKNSYLSHRVKLIRTDKGLTQKQLEERAALVPNAIKEIEDENIYHYTTQEEVEKIAKVLDVSYDYLIGLEDADNPNLRAGIYRGGSWFKKIKHLTNVTKSEIDSYLNEGWKFMGSTTWEGTGEYDCYVGVLISADQYETRINNAIGARDELNWVCSFCGNTINDYISKPGTLRFPTRKGHDDYEEELQLLVFVCGRCGHIDLFHTKTFAKEI